MGVYIPNMEKPKGCLECWSGLSIVINCEAGIGFWNPNGDRVPPDCPLIDIVECWECEYYQGHEEYCEIDHFAREHGFCYSGKRRNDEHNT